MTHKLFLIPTSLSNTNKTHVLIESERLRILHLKHFIVENAKVARSHLKCLNLTTSLQELSIFEINKHKDNLEQLLKPIVKEFDIGLMSDCGLPAIADPGSEVVKFAHLSKIEVVPLCGPSSLMLALMASGVNGQSFAFVGYLPIDKLELVQKINYLKEQVNRHNQTQIIIETPFRAQNLLLSLVTHLEERQVLTLAINLMETEQKIISKPVYVWKKEALPEINKSEVVFVIGR